MRLHRPIGVLMLGCEQVPKAAGFGTLVSLPTLPRVDLSVCSMPGVMLGTATATPLHPGNDFSLFGAHCSPRISTILEC